MHSFPTQGLPGVSYACTSTLLDPILLGSGLVTLFFGDFREKKKLLA